MSSLLAKHNRNHSFPPSLQYLRSRSSRTLESPLPDIDDAPWAHFLSDPDEDEQLEYLHLDAGILANESTGKRKTSKFRPTNDRKWSNKVHYHHGSFTRQAEPEHDYFNGSHDMRGELDDYVPSATETMAFSHPLDRASNRRALSSHRHSWQQPAAHLFSVDEELPSIIVSDYDAEERVETRDFAGLLAEAVVNGEQGSEHSGMVDERPSPTLEHAPSLKLDIVRGGEKARL